MSDFISPRALPTLGDTADLPIPHRHQSRRIHTCCECNQAITSCTCYGYDAESESGYGYNDDAVSMIVNLSDTDNDCDSDDWASEGSLLSDISNFSELEAEFGTFDEVATSGDIQSVELETSNTSTSWPNMSTNFRDENGPPASKEVYIDLGALETLDGYEADVEDEPSARGRTNQKSVRN